MPFVDPLTVMLIGLASGTAIGGFYFFFAARGNYEHVKALIFPAAGIGLFNFISGFYMSFAWPFPATVAAYNMLFGDPLLLFGLFLMVAAAMGYKDPKGFHMGIFPVLILFLGVYVLVGAYSIVQLKLESGQDLITAMGLYVFDGIGALLAPIMYLNPEKPSTRYIYYLEWIILGVGTIFALVIGMMGLNEHLASPP